MNGGHAEGEVLVRHEPEPGRPDHVFEDFLLRKLPDALDEILVRVPIAGQHLAHRRNNLKESIILDPKLCFINLLLPQASQLGFVFFI